MKKNIGRKYMTPRIEEIKIATEQVFAQSGIGGSHSGFTDGDWGNEEYENFN